MVTIQIAHEVINEKIVVCCRQDREHVLGCLESRPFACTQHRAGQVSRAGHGMVRAAAPVHTILGPVAARALRIPIPAARQYRATPPRVDPSMDVAQTESEIIVFADEPLTRIDVPTRRNPPLRLPHATHVLSRIATLEEQDDLAVDQAHRQLSAMLVAVDVAIGDLHVGVCQPGAAISVPRGADVRI